MPGQPATSSSTTGCPTCGGALRRARRLPEDRIAVPGREGWRRYRCGASGCGWQGLLPRGASGGARQSGSRSGGAGGRAGSRAPSRLRYLAVGLLLAGLAGLPLAAVLALIGLGGLAGPRAAVASPSGASHEGVPLEGEVLQRVKAPGAMRLTMADALAPERQVAVEVEPLKLRRGCAWGEPGRDPYRGTTEQALRAAGLPPEVVSEVVALRLAGHPTDQLEIRNESIRALGDGRSFDPRSLALTFGHTLCLNSRVNFPRGHVEKAALYEARDARGRWHSIMVPEVCGNVSVLGARAQRDWLDEVSEVLAQRSAEVAGLAVAMGQPIADEHRPGEAKVAGARRERPPAAQHGSPGTTLAERVVPRKLTVPALNQLSDLLARGSIAAARLGARRDDGPDPTVRPKEQEVQAIPEPGTLACVLLALLALLAVRRRKR